MNTVLVNSFFEAKVDQLYEVLSRLSGLLEDAGVKYQLVGGMATYMHVNRIDPLEARLTRDVDICVRRKDLARIAEFAGKHGFQFRHAAGIDMLLDRDEPKAHSAVHFVFSGEKVRPDYVATVPEIDQPDRFEQFCVAPVSHLLQMKLTSNRIKDMTHVRDLLNVGLITPEMEAALPPALRERLDYIKSRE
jgi:hypothetical protein